MKLRITCIMGMIFMGAMASWSQAVTVAGTITTTGGRQPATMVMMDQGMMVLTNGVLAKYDSKSLEQKGSVSLLPPLPPQPTRPAVMDQTTRQAYQQELQDWNAQAAKYRETPVMTTLGQYLLIVMGDQFYRVDADTMKIEVQSSVVSPAVAADPTLAITGVTPILALNGTALYVLRSTEMVVIDIKEGKILASGALPAEMAPVAAVRQPGGGGGGGFAGGGGGGTQPVLQSTLIGTIVNHADIEGGIWTIKLDTTGDEYVLGGTALEKLLATPDVEGKRARLTGTVVAGAGAAQYGKGTFNITDFQIL